MVDITKLFSHSDLYSKARPKYPLPLFEFLAALTGEHNLAWDVATGNGQAAEKLAKHYKQVVGTDVNEEQLAKAVRHPNITYLPLPAELTDEQRSNHAQLFGTQQFDVVTIAQGIHWFNLTEFYRVVKRVLKPRSGVIAAWTYSLPCIDDEVNSAIANFYNNVVYPYWLFNRRLVEDCYESIDFPFEELNEQEVKLAKCDLKINDLRSYCSTHPNMNYILPTSVPQRSKPLFFYNCEWAYSDLLSYVSSWSSVQLANKELKRDVMVDADALLRPAWQNAAARRGVPQNAIQTSRLNAIFPIFMRIGRYIPK